MRYTSKLSVFLLAAALPGAALADSGKTPPGQMENNWGEMTSGAIAGGWPQGAHSSDPGENGKGKDDPDQPRQGLPNLYGDGDLGATIQALDN